MHIQVHGVVLHFFSMAPASGFGCVAGRDERCRFLVDVLVALRCPYRDDQGVAYSNSLGVLVCVEKRPHGSEGAVGRSSKEATRAYSKRRERLRAQQDSPTALFAGTPNPSLHEYMEILVTDRLRSYAAAKAELGLSEPRTGIAQEQSRRVFSQVDKAAREKDAALQVAWISPTVLVHSRRSARRLRHRTAFDIPANNGVLRGDAFGHGERQLQREARRSVQALTPPFGSSGDSPDRTDADVILENERGLLPWPDG